MLTARDLTGAVVAEEEPDPSDRRFLCQKREPNGYSTEAQAEEEIPPPRDPPPPQRIWRQAIPPLDHVKGEENEGPVLYQHISRKRAEAGSGQSPNQPCEER